MGKIEALIIWFFMVIGLGMLSWLLSFQPIGYGDNSQAGYIDGYTGNDNGYQNCMTYVQTFVTLYGIPTIDSQINGTDFSEYYYCDGYIKGYQTKCNDVRTKELKMQLDNTSSMIKASNVY